MKRKLISVASMLIAGSLLFSACGSDSGTTASETQSSSTGTGAQASGTSGEKSYFKKYDEPITLTTHAVVGADTMYQDGGTAENNAWTQWQKEHLGIIWKLKWVAPDGATDQQKLDLAFASGDLPDVISPTKEQLAKYVAEDQILPLNNLIEDYASPLIKWAIEEAKERTKGSLFLPFTKAGQIYGFPVMKELMDYYNTNFIRDDILNQMGIAVPKTLAEYENVLEKYHQQYPKGYGLGMDNTLSAQAIPMAAYKAYPKHWVKTGNGEIVYGSIQPEAREALVKLAEWYKKGYIDPEFAVKDNSKLQEDVVQGNILTYYGHWASIAAPFNGMWSKVAGSNVTCMPNLTGEDGKTGVMANPWFDGSRAITKACKNPEAVMYLLNENWDSFYRNYTDLREKMKNEYGYEFKYPVTEERKPLNVDQVARDYPGAAQPRQLWKYDYPADLEGCGFMNSFYTHYTVLFGFTGGPVSIANGALASMADAVNKNDTSVLIGEGKNMYAEWTNTNPKMLTTFASTYNYWSEFEKTDEFSADAFSGAATPTMTEKKQYLDKLELETYTRIIMGSLPITAFDEFVQNWKKNGGDQITKEVNEWAKGL